MRAGVTNGSSECVEACFGCARACDEAAAELVENGDREVVNALIAAVATTRLVGVLLGESDELADGIAELCIAACRRCIELGAGDPTLAEAVEACADCIACLGLG